MNYKLLELENLVNEFMMKAYRHKLITYETFPEVYFDEHFRDIADYLTGSGELYSLLDFIPDHDIVDYLRNNADPEDYVSIEWKF